MKRKAILIGVLLLLLTGSGYVWSRMQARGFS